MATGNDARRNSSTARSIRNITATHTMSSSKQAHHAATARPAPTHPTESHTILFEWPVTGLKNIFDSSKTDGKSKQIKSVPFGHGRWTVLFYAHSGHDNNSSIYLNAEPLQSERIQPFLGAATSTDPPTDAGWERQGVFRFTFTIQTIDKSAVLATKEAHDHAFSHKTSNWGWAQFIKRDAVYYSNNAVKQSDSFLITVSIQASPSRPNPAQPVGITVPPVLVQSYGSLLDSPEHSDVVFHLVTPRHKTSSTQGATTRNTHRTRHIYAIKKILADRSEYFRDMFEGGFSEGEQNDDDEDDEDTEDSQGGDDDRDNDDNHSDADADARDVNMDGSAPSTARPASTTSRSAYIDDGDSEVGQEHEPLLHDSDAEIDGTETAADNASTTKLAASTPAHRRDGRKRRKVVVRDSSYATFKALLFFLYTDTIDFAPLTSSFIEPRAMGETWSSGSGGTGPRKSRASTSKASSTTTPPDFNTAMLKAHARRQEAITLYTQKHPHRPSPCSAKAMYRLADKLQIPDLKKRAQEHLCSSLTVHNIVWEAFSSFTSQFAEVRKMEVQFLLRHWQAVKKTQAMKSIFHRAHAHPGLAEVWPHLLSQLDYRHVAGGASGARGAVGANAAAGADLEEFDMYDDDDDDDDMGGVGTGATGGGTGAPPHDDEDDEDGEGLLFNAEN